MVKKRITLGILVLAVLSNLFVGGTIFAASPKSIQLESTKVIPKIDGIVDESYGKPILDYSAKEAMVWYDNIEETDPAAKLAVSKMTAQGYMVWNSRYFYFASNCSDNKFYDAENRNGAYLCTGNSLIFDIDGREIEIKLVSTQNEGTIAIAYQKGMGELIAGSSTKSVVDGSKYSMETKIPWTSIGIKDPKAVKNLKFNFRQNAQTTDDLHAKAVYSFLAEKTLPLTLIGDGKYEATSDDAEEATSGDNSGPELGATYVTVPKKVTAYEVKTAPAIDGVTDEIYGDPFCYLVAQNLPDANVYPESNPELNLFMNPELKMKMQALAYTVWDKDYLYVTATVTGSNRLTLASARRNMFWEADNCEFIVWINDTRKKLTFSLDENSKMKVFDSGIEDPSSWKAALTQDAKSFTFEVAIPWTYYGVQPKEGDNFKISFDAMTNFGTMGIHFGHPFDNDITKATPFSLAGLSPTAIENSAAVTEESTTSDTSVDSMTNDISARASQKNIEKDTSSTQTKTAIIILIVIAAVIICGGGLLLVYKRKKK